MITERRSLGGEAKVYRAPTAEVIARARLRCRVNKTVPAQLNHVAQLASDAGGAGGAGGFGVVWYEIDASIEETHSVCV